MVACLDRADRDDAVRAVIVTGSGRGFCAGADMSAGAARFDVAGRAEASPDSEGLRDSGGRLALRIFACTKPVIAAVNGAAVGVGATMLLPMDIRLAATGARFAFPFTRRGLVPEACSSWFLPRAVGMQRAMEWVATGRLIPAEEALASGLVRSLHAPTTSSRRPAPSRARSPGPPRRSPSRSPGRCCGGCSGPTTRWRRTGSRAASSPSGAAAPT